MDDFVELSPEEGAALNFPVRPGIGHNSPPLSELLREEIAPLAKRKDDLLAACERVPETIRDEITSGRVADLIKLMIKCRQQAKKDHTARKEPFLENGRLVDSAYKAITDPLDRAKVLVENKLTLYQRQVAEDERRAREAEARRQAEEAKRQAMEAEAAAAKLETEADLDAAITAEELARQAAADAALAQRATTVKAAELSRTRGEFGSTASLTTFWDFKDLHPPSVDLEALRPFLDGEAVQRAVRAFIRSGGRQLVGCTIYQNTKSRVV